MYLLTSATPKKERLFPYTSVTDRVFGAFAKLRKATISFVKHVYPSIHPINRGSILDSDKRLSLPLERPDRFGPPASLLFNRDWRLCSRLQQSERESDHSHPTSDELKNDWNCTSPPYIITTYTKMALILSAFYRSIIMNQNIFA